jgi:hypothetical protein
MTPRKQLEEWIREQVKKDGQPRNDAEFERLTDRVMLAHREELHHPRFVKSALWFTIRHCQKLPPWFWRAFKELPPFFRRKKQATVASRARRETPGRDSEPANVRQPGQQKRATRRQKTMLKERARMRSGASLLKLPRFKPQAKISMNYDEPNLTTANLMSKPVNSTTDQRRERLIAELTRVNDELHQLRLRARQLNEEFLALKNGASKKPSSPPKPLASPKKLASVSKPSPKPLAKDDEFWLGAVGD